MVDRTGQMLMETIPTKREVAEGGDTRLVAAESELVRLRPGARTFRFLEVHRANPHIWLAFLAFARETREVRDHYSADTIYHRLRYYLDVQTFGARRTDAAGVDARELKLNNNWRSYYARLLELYAPGEFGEFFASRGRRGEEA
jgi:hypothetical protein